MGDLNSIWNESDETLCRSVFENESIQRKRVLRQVESARNHQRTVTTTGIAIIIEIETGKEIGTKTERREGITGDVILNTRLAVQIVTIHGTKRRTATEIERESTVVRGIETVTVTNLATTATMNATKAGNGKGRKIVARKKNDAEMRKKVQERVKILDIQLSMKAKSGKQGIQVGENGKEVLILTVQKRYVFFWPIDVWSCPTEQQCRG